MKKLVHDINFAFAMLQLFACCLLVGFYSLPFFGIFQTLIMLYSVRLFPRFDVRERKLFRIYWIGYVIFFLILLFMENFKVSYGVPMLIFLGFYMISLAAICVRFTSLITKKNN